MIATFATFSVALSLFFWVLLVGVLLLSEDHIFDRQLDNELTRQKTYFERHQKFDQLRFGMTLYLDEDAQHLPYYTILRYMPQGARELEGENLHIGRSEVNGKPFYIVFNIDNSELNLESFVYFHLMFLVVFLILAITGITVGAVIGIRITRPILKLDRRIQSLTESTHAGTVGLFGETDSFGDDEVGRLARSFAQTLDRSQQFLEREQRFTREVSHELRTPVAVIRGALDILELQPDNPRALGRIRKANQELQQLIEMFLLLGREDDSGKSDQPHALADICQTVVQQHQKEAQVPVRLVVNQSPELYVLPQIFAVLLGNLLGNAIRHTTEGEIVVTLDQQQLVVEDSGSGFSEQILNQVGKPYVKGSLGQGLGLSIVSRICEQFDWRMEIVSSVGSGSRVSILFSASS